MIKCRNITCYDLVDFAIPAMFVLSIPISYFKWFWMWGGIKTATVLLSIYIVVKGWNSVKNNFKFFFTGFLVFNFLEIIPYIYNDRPISFFWADMPNYILPMLFVYIGLTDNRPNRLFFDRIVYPAAIVFLFGLYLYMTTPDWYISSLLEVKSSSWFAVTTYSNESFVKVMRFSGLFQDSYPVSHYSIFCLSIALFNVFRLDEKKNFSFLCAIIFLVSAIFSQHRIAIVCSMVLFVTFFILKYQINSIKHIKYLFLILFAIGCFIFLDVSFFHRFDEIVSLLTNRVSDNMSFSKALGERRMVEDLLGEMKYYAFGHGIGSGGAVARSQGYAGVTDMNYVKLLFETGVCGFLLFVILMFATLGRGLRYLRYFASEVSIIIFILLAMTGSNSLCLYYMYILPFWYSVGKIWNLNYLNVAITKGIRL